MLNLLAKLLNDLGNLAEQKGRHSPAKLLYRSAIMVRPGWSSPWFNLGLQAKSQCDWESSLRFNERAATLASNDEASWWNLGIAATALRDWETAYRAWKGCGIELERGDDEVSMPPVTACVRLNPDKSGEVVWGTRIDPARIQINNVPLPDSKRRFRDILLNDGAPAGTRKSGENEYPVFDELAVWQPSIYSTFQSALTTEDADAERALARLCNECDIGFENWSTIRQLCSACSHGSPEPHTCSEDSGIADATNYGFAVKSRETLVHALRSWAEAIPGRGFSDPQLVLLAE
jgi:hypothetical protein